MRLRQAGGRLLTGGTLLLAALGPTSVSAQVELSAGLLGVPDASLGGRQVGPMVAAAVSRDVGGLPLFLEAAVGRTDFASLGQDYHHVHYLAAIGAEWFIAGGATGATRGPARPPSGSTRVGVRLGLGAYGESETVETEPPSPGGENWVEAVIPGLVVEREMANGTRLVVRLSDAILGPWFAILDSSEYDIEHRLLLVFGIRF